MRIKCCAPAVSLTRQLATAVILIAIGQHTGATEPGKKPEANPEKKLPQSILFTSMRNGHVQLVLLDSNGVDMKELTNSSVNNTYPGWSPDGKQIVFASQDALGKGLFVM